MTKKRRGSRQSAHGNTVTGALIIPFTFHVTGCADKNISSSWDMNLYRSVSERRLKRGLYLKRSNEVTVMNERSDTSLFSAIKKRFSLCLCLFKTNTINCYLCYLYSRMNIFISGKMARSHIPRWLCARCGRKSNVLFVLPQMSSYCDCAHLLFIQLPERMEREALSAVACLKPLPVYDKGGTGGNK